jgi:hypothetical protein
MQKNIPIVQPLAHPNTQKELQKNLVFFSKKGVAQQQ